MLAASRSNWLETSSPIVGDSDESRSYSLDIPAGLCWLETVSRRRTDGHCKNCRIMGASSLERDHEFTLLIQSLCCMVHEVVDPIGHLITIIKGCSRAVSSKWFI